MLSQNKILMYIKNNLSLDFEVLEMSDKKILEHIRMFTLDEFGQYIPDKIEFVINTITAKKYKNKKNAIYIELPEEYEDREIYNVVDLITSKVPQRLFGHDLFGINSFSNLPQTMVQNVEQNIQYKYSKFNFGFAFKQPNILYITPFQEDSRMIIQLEQTHDSNFTTIPKSYEQYFLDFQLQDVMILIGNYRNKFSNLQTPYGDISLNTDFHTEGLNKKRELIDEFKNHEVLTNIILDVD